MKDGSIGSGIMRIRALAWVFLKQVGISPTIRSGGGYAYTGELYGGIGFLVVVRGIEVFFIASSLIEASWVSHFGIFGPTGMMPGFHHYGFRAVGTTVGLAGNIFSQIRPPTPHSGSESTASAPVLAFRFRSVAWNANTTCMEDVLETHPASRHRGRLKSHSVHVVVVLATLACKLLLSSSHISTAAVLSNALISLSWTLMNDTHPQEYDITRETCGLLMLCHSVSRLATTMAMALLEAPRVHGCRFLVHPMRARRRSHMNAPDLSSSNIRV